MNDQTLPIRSEPGDERSADHLPVEERSLEGHHDEIAPWFVDRVAHPNDRVSAFPIEGGRRADDKIVVRRPGEDIARIGRFERDRARFEIDAIHVEGLRIAPVQRDENELRMLQVGQDILRPHAGKRGQVAHFVVRQVGGEKMIDFVAGVVLEIKDMFCRRRPMRYQSNRAVILVRYRSRIFSIEPADPNIQDAIFVSARAMRFACRPAKFADVNVRDFRKEFRAE